MNTRVDFYVLSQEHPYARLRQACQLAEQAASESRRVYLRTTDAAEAQQLDELLWTFQDGSFLPHEIYTGAPPSHARVMVLLGEIPPPTDHCQLLVNLDEAVPEPLDAYEHIAEIVDLDPRRKASARERYKHYRERGCTLESHNL